MFFSFFIAHIFEGIVFILKLYVSEDHIIVIADKFGDDFVGFDSIFVGEVFLIFMECIFGYFDSVILFSFSFFMDGVDIGSNFKFEDRLKVICVDVDDIFGDCGSSISGEFGEEGEEDDIDER